MTPPPPFTPADCDLRDFRNMPLDVQRFRDSDLVTEEEPEAIVAAIFLWGAAWHQLPAASLPNDDRALARFAGYGRSLRDWHEVKDAALRGFVECSDGRLYHPVLAEKANAAWDKRLQLQWTRAKDRHRKAEKDLAAEDRTPFPEFEAWKENRVVPDHKPGKQGRLPLERDELSDGTEAPSARAIGARNVGARAPAHTEEGKKPNDSRNRSDGNGGSFRRKEDPIPLENALKGKEKEKEKIEDKNPLPLPDHLNRTRDAQFPEADLVALHEAVCNAAGYRPINPSAIAASMDEVKAWRDRGLDFETIVLPAIRHVVATSKADDRTRTLGRFRHAIAREEAKAHGAKAVGRVHKPSEAPLLEPKDEDEKFRPLRKALLDRLGPIPFVAAFNPVRFEIVEVEFGDPRVPLKIRGSDFAVRAALDNHGAAILSISKSLGLGVTVLW